MIRTEQSLFHVPLTITKNGLLYARSVLIPFVLAVFHLIAYFTYS